MEQKSSGSWTNIIIALCWIGLGIFAMIDGWQLGLFGVIPIPNILIIIIGVVWLFFGIRAKMQPAAPEPEAGQMYGDQAE